jgi:mono/diheme cytochrome c family protein
MIRRLIAAFAVVIFAIGMTWGVPVCFAEERAPAAPERQGHALAERMCGQCHAVGKSGSSPHPAAPAFRELSRRVNLDRLTNRLREGLISGHPDMPMFRFTPEDARALTAYLRSIQGP